MRYRWILLLAWIMAVMTVIAQDITIETWAYQLQNVDIDALAVSGYDLIVMDYSADGTSDEAYSAEEIDRLHEAGKIVLAYMSVGEAEDYRFYWDDSWDDNPPTWLDEENPNWEGNYKVRYWDDDWQALIIDHYLQAILDADFDGVYLDIIDAYDYYEAQGRESSGQEMVDWVATIATAAHEQNPDFMIFPQNGAQLALDYPDYLDVVDGIGQEDIYYGYEADNEIIPDDARIELEAALDAFVEADKIVLVVAYTDDPDQIADHTTRSQARGYIPLATYRDLDRLP
ncbi:MAG: endo alpha-1,4 polygalactosaminidase [Anaerolineae bacterium]|nr:endo alpha-1,4 polygalactosaminidase [Anaerolineae bacterium]